MASQKALLVFYPSIFIDGEKCFLNQANFKTQVLIGDPKEKICDAVEEMHVDLLVMGSRAFGPIKRYKFSTWRMLLLLNYSDWITRFT